MSGKLPPFLHPLINRAEISAVNTATYMQLIHHNIAYVSCLCATAVAKTTLHSPNRGTLRCFLIVYYINKLLQDVKVCLVMYITNQTSTSCNTLL